MKTGYLLVSSWIGTASCKLRDSSYVLRVANCQLRVARTKENKVFGHFLNVVSFNIQMHMTEQQ